MSRAVTRDVLALRASSLFVCGDALLDVYLTGGVERISPEAPVAVVSERGRRAVPGGAANVAATAAALGARTWLAGQVGRDAEGEELRALCERAGIRLDGLVDAPSAPTARKTRVLAGYQQIVRLDREDVRPILPEVEAAILGAFEAFLEGTEPAAGRAVVLADYAKGVLTPGLARALIARARAADVPVVVDPKAQDLRPFAGATAIKPNAVEARAIAARAGVADPDPLALADAVLAAVEVEHVVLSLAAEGVLVRSRGAAPALRLPSHVLRVADVSGAGDTMVCVLALGLGAGLALDRTVELANVAAGRVCEELGTAVLSASDLLDAFQRRGESVAPEKWIAEHAVAGRVAAQERADGRTVVFANGCFDLLHAGHVRLLQAARALGDFLVVGLNADESVRRLKGPTRPVSELPDRVAVLSALACVDLVVAFAEDTPLELIEALRPDVIVKGGDYAPEDVVGGAEAAAWGGRVEIVALLEGRSTSGLLRAGAPA